MVKAGTTIAWLWSTSRGLRLQATLNAIISVVLVLLDFAFISATKWAVDIATHKAQGELRMAAIALIAVVVVRLAISFGSRWIAAILGVRSQNRIQARIYAHAMLSEWQGREALHTGDVLNRLEHDVKDITNTLTETLPSLLAVLVRLVGAFIFLYTLDHTLPYILLFISPVFVLMSKFYVKRMRELARTIRDMDSRIQSHMQESLQYRMVIKTLERCHTMISRLEEMQCTLRAQVRRSTLFSSTSALLLSTGFSMGYLITFLWGVSRLEAGTVTYGTMLAFIQLVGQIQAPFRELSRYVPRLVSCLTSCERLMELEATPLEQEGQSVCFAKGAGIRLSDVSFAYTEDERQVIDRLTFDFPRGSVTAVLGETGAGKTTLIRLIMALVRPTNGRIELYDETGGVEVSPLTRANIIYIPQGNTLLSGTVRDNLLLGKPDATDEEMRRALNTACADFVLERPEGLDTRCGEQGAGLSEGQSQRIAIARALLREGCILLLDEATSALDGETERCLLSNLASRKTEGQTIICVTHRPAVEQYCTQTLHLERLKV